MFYAQSTAKGYIRAKENVFLPQVQILIHYSIHVILPSKNETLFFCIEKMKLKEPGRQTLGR